MLSSMLNSLTRAAETRVKHTASRVQFMLYARSWRIPESWLALTAAERRDIQRLLARRADITQQSVDLRRKIMDSDALALAESEIREMRAVADLVRALDTGDIPAPAAE